MQNQLVINKNKMEDRKPFIISNSVSFVSYPSNKSDQNEVNTIKNLLQYSTSIAYLRKKGFYKTCTFDC